jgi:hypothetical protein
MTQNKQISFAIVLFLNVQKCVFKISLIPTLEGHETSVNTTTAKVCVTGDRSPVILEQIEAQCQRMM